MKILYIGKFEKLWDEEYIARSFEMLGHQVIRVDEKAIKIPDTIRAEMPDIVLFAKLQITSSIAILKTCKELNITTICWIFDLYWGYTREPQIKHLQAFKADIVITTDGGHDQKFKDLGINHHCVRQGIYKPECYLTEGTRALDVIFVGSHNPNNQRQEIINKLQQDFNLKWFGRENTNEIRSVALNDLFANSKIVVGDSVFSPYYWSNRVVETLGRGGFLIHREVQGLKVEYPFIVTYTDYEDLKAKIQYYLEHDKEREELRKKNFEWVRDNYTCDKQCAKIIEIYEASR